MSEGSSSKQQSKGRAGLWVIKKNISVPVSSAETKAADEDNTQRYHIVHSKKPKSDKSSKAVNRNVKGSSSNKQKGSPMKTHKHTGSVNTALQHPTNKGPPKINTTHPTGAVIMNNDPVDENNMCWILGGRISHGACRGLEEGELVKIKVFKRSAVESGLAFSERDIEGHDMAKKICDDFNEANIANGKVFVGASAKLTAAKDHVDSRNRLIAAKGQVMLMYEALEGDTIQFTGNDGPSNVDCNLPSFLSHWSWVNSASRSEGRTMICCLEGVRGISENGSVEATTKYYCFVDPAVMSEGEGKFGVRDLGSEGIKGWFEKHKCNEMCKDSGIAGNVPIQEEEPDKKKQARKVDDFTTV